MKSLKITYDGGTFQVELDGAEGNCKCAASNHIEGKKTYLKYIEDMIDTEISRMLKSYNQIKKEVK